jgi:hypothetical protein
MLALYARGDQAGNAETVVARSCGNPLKPVVTSKHAAGIGKHRGQLDETPRGVSSFLRLATSLPSPSTSAMS